VSSRQHCQQAAKCFLDVTRGSHITEAHMAWRLAPGFKCRTMPRCTAASTSALAANAACAGLSIGRVVLSISVPLLQVLIVDKEAKRLALLDDPALHKAGGSRRTVHAGLASRS